VRQKLLEDNSMPLSVHAGFLQSSPKILAIRENTAAIVKMLSEVSSALIVLPELATTGYSFKDLAEVMGVAEPADLAKSPSLSTIAEVAAKQLLHVVVGFAERHGNKVYNSAALIGPKGLISVYRKIHLYDREKLYFEPGDAPPPVIDLPDIGRVGLMICYDWYFPETARSLAFRGADIIAHPANLVLPWCLDAMKTRSLENKVFTITANRTGLEANFGIETEFYGRSQVLSPTGDVLLKVGKDATGVFTALIEPELARNKAISTHNPGPTEVRRNLLPLK
jgi:predicted amidohydrolase